jgi:anti-anti-sigma factor
MERQHVAMGPVARPENKEDTIEGVAEQIAADAGEHTVEQRIDLNRGTARPRPPAPIEDAKPHTTHTLVLIGELNRGSTQTLEAEIERLCDGGIHAITLDLGQLTAIDSAGVAVIAFRSRWCARRGCGLALIPGSAAIQRAFELASVGDSLRFKEGPAEI